jgi:hypothetical protein
VPGLRRGKQDLTARTLTPLILVRIQVPQPILIFRRFGPHKATDELTYRAAVDAFGVHGVAELCYLVGLYCLVSVTLNGFDVPVPEPEEGPV